MTDQNNAIALEPCPFCGSHSVTTVIDDASGHFWLVGCTACLTQGPAKVDMTEAITAWNTRKGGPNA